MFSSLRNSLEAHLSLLENAGAHTILLPNEIPPVVNQILGARPMERISFGEVNDFLSDEEVPLFPFDLTFDEAKNRTFCILHTSGSTGIPKPIRVAYGTLAANDAHQLIPSLGGRETLMTYLQGKRYFLALPLFHAACINFAVVFNVFSGVIPVIPPPKPITADLANEVFLHGNLDGALMAPSLIIDCFNNDEFCVNMVKHVKFLSYVGGALPAEVGDLVAKRVKLMAVIGSCETALHPLEMHDDPEDWQYFSFSPFLGHSFQPYGEDGVSELTLVKDPKYELFQGVFCTFPEKDVFNTSDLFRQHPQKANKWAFNARSDDIIAFTTAEKLNPITMEGIISTNPYVKSALIGGQGQFQASLLIEPRICPETKEEEEQLMQKIWPSVLKANQSCPAHGKIMKGFVIFTGKNNPLPRAGKDTVQRQGALKLYEEEFKALYSKMKPHIANGQSSGTPAVDTKEVRVNGQDSTITTNGVASRKPKNGQQLITITAVELDLLIEQSVRKHLEAVLIQIFSGLKENTFKGSSSVMPASTNGTYTKEPQVAQAPTQQSKVKTPAPIPVLNGSSQPEDDRSKMRNMIYDHLKENIILDHFNDSSDMFKAGLDSVSVAPLLNGINAFLIKNKPEAELLTLKLVYEDGITVDGLLKCCGL